MKFTCPECGLNAWAKPSAYCFAVSVDVSLWRQNKKKCKTYNYIVIGLYLLFCVAALHQTKSIFFYKNILIGGFMTAVSRWLTGKVG